MVYCHLSGRMLYVRWKLPNAAAFCGRSFSNSRPTMNSMSNRLFRFALRLSFVALLGLCGGAVSAANITVTTTADGIDAAASAPTVTLASLPGPDGQVTLREAISAANSNAGADTITFSVNGTFTLAGAANEDNGSVGDLDVKQSVTI